MDLEVGLEHLLAHHLAALLAGHLLPLPLADLLLLPLGPLLLLLPALDPPLHSPLGYQALLVVRLDLVEVDLLRAGGALDEGVLGVILVLHVVDELVRVLKFLWKAYIHDVRIQGKRSPQTRSQKGLWQVGSVKLQPIFTADIIGGSSSLSAGRAVEEAPQVDELEVAEQLGPLLGPLAGVDRRLEGAERARDREGLIADFPALLVRLDIVVRHEVLERPLRLEAVAGELPVLVPLEALWVGRREAALLALVGLRVPRR